MVRRGAIVGVLLPMALGMALGCARVPYVPGRNIETGDMSRLPPGEPQIERGRPAPFADELASWTLGLPSKIILWNTRVDNHDISPATEAKLRQYLADNDLRSVKVRLNQYAVGDEWRRLFSSRSMHGFWRYTLGVLSVASYTAFPGRAFGGDNYNPYTNTINLYSDHKGVALHEAGHAKDFAGRHHKGAYSAIRLLPLVALYQEGIATGDAIGYDRDKGLSHDEKADYKILYPAYCTYIAGEGLRWVQVEAWVQYAIQIVACVPGHVVGRIKAATVRHRPASRSAALESPLPTGGAKPL